MRDELTGGGLYLYCVPLQLGSELESVHNNYSYQNKRLQGNINIDFAIGSALHLDNGQDFCKYFQKRVIPFGTQGHVLASG